MKNLRIFDIGTIVTLLLAIITGVFWLGNLNGRLSEIKPETINERINNIQKEVEKSSKVRIDDLPVGSIVQSVLPLAVFSASVGEQGEFNPKTSKWAPCDNRSIEGSALAGKGINEAPDIRGAFVRGLNSFSSDESQVVDPNHSDPDKLRTAGSYQSDGVGSHTHIMRYKADWGRSSKDPKQSYPGISYGADPGPAPSFKTEGPRPSSVETRPKNVALYFYIKIN